MYCSLCTDLINKALGMPFWKYRFLTAEGTDNFPLPQTGEIITPPRGTYI